MNNKQTLKRSLNLPLITLYGLGNILGAGIYVLVGKVAGEAGYYAPLAFFIASIIAAISAFTYAEMSARYPVSAGEAVYLHEGLNLKPLTIAVGLMITVAGMVSASAMAHGFAGYFSVFVDLPPWVLMAGLILFLGALAIWGITESVTAAAILTIVEMLGLIMIIFVGADYVTTADISSKMSEQQSIGAIPWLGVFGAAFLAFYAYIGFEDMVNVAEEVKEPEKNMPRAIIIALIISTILYAGVSIVAVMVIEPSVLTQSKAPLADVYQTATGKVPVLIGLIGIFAVVNGGLIQIVMASRLFYGMAKNGWLPEFFTEIHPKTRTPVKSTLVVIAIVLTFALVLHLTTLAAVTSFLVLTVFALVNLSLIKIKKSNPHPEKVRVFSIWIPRLGLVTTVGFLLLEVLSNIF